MPRPLTTVTEVKDGFQLEFGKRITFSGRPNKMFRTCFKPKSCKDCPLFERLKINPDHDNFRTILAVGEGPGEDEWIKMSPLTGASGTYLRGVEEDTELAKFGIGHSNIILCEGGKRLEFDDPDALWDAIDLCTETFLWDEIEELKPKLVVPLGNIPKSIFLPGERKGIGAIAGSLYLIDDCDYNIMPVHHPAHIVRNPKMHPMFWDELNEVRLYFEQKPGPFKVHVGNTKTIEMMMAQDQPIGVDFETTSYHPWDIGTFEANGKMFQWGDIICMSVCIDGLNSYLFTKSDVDKKYHTQLKELLESKGASCQNGQFDLLFLKKFNINPILKEDTMLASYAMDESPSHPLKRLARRHLGMEDWSQALELYPDRFKSYAFIPENILFPYCGMDTAAEKLLEFTLLKKMDRDENRLYKELLLPCANMFLDINYKGIPIDLGKLMELKRKWSRDRLVVIKKLKHFGVRNCNSPYQVSDALNKFEVVDYDAVTVKANLLGLAKIAEREGNLKGAELCDLVVEYRELTKAIDTVLHDVAKSVCFTDSRIHPDAKLYATVTGRLVYGEPSLLNFPSATRLAEELRTIFSPDKGSLWGHRDQKQFEMRVYAVINNDLVLIEVFGQDRDPHEEVGSFHFGTIELTRIGKLNGQTRDEIIVFGKPYYLAENKRTKGYTRVAIKACDFGTMYGRGDESIASQWGIPIEDAHAFRMTVLSFLPDIKKYWRDMEIILNTEQEAVNPLGRKRRFPIITESNYHECLLQIWNFPIQSTANDLNLLGMYAMWASDYCKHGLLLPFFPVHDATEYQENEKYSDEIEEWITETLASVPRNKLEPYYDVSNMKFKTDVGLGYNWAEASRKE